MIYICIFGNSNVVIAAKTALSGRNKLKEDVDNNYEFNNKSHFNAAYL